jgi:hypothetical protein
MIRINANNYSVVLIDCNRGIDRKPSDLTIFLSCEPKVLIRIIQFYTVIRYTTNYRLHILLNFWWYST